MTTDPSPWSLWEHGEVSPASRALLGCLARAPSLAQRCHQLVPLVCAISITPWPWWDGEHRARAVHRITGVHWDMEKRVVFYPKIAFSLQRKGPSGSPRVGGFRPATGRRLTHSYGNWRDREGAIPLPSGNPSADKPPSASLTNTCS